MGKNDLIISIVKLKTKEGFKITAGIGSVYDELITKKDIELVGLPEDVYIQSKIDNLKSMLLGDIKKMYKAFQENNIQIEIYGEKEKNVSKKRA